MFVEGGLLSLLLSGDVEVVGVGSAKGNGEEGGKVYKGHSVLPRDCSVNVLDRLAPTLVHVRLCE